VEYQLIFNSISLIRVLLFRFLFVAPLFILLFYNAAHADSELLYRTHTLREIQSQLSEQDKDLAEQLVDIRIQQERKLGIKPLIPAVIINNASTSNSTHKFTSRSIKQHQRSFHLFRHWKSMVFGLRMGKVWEFPSQN